MMVASCRLSRLSSRWWLGGVRAMQTDARQAIGAHAPSGGLSKPTYGSRPCDQGSDALDVAVGCWNNAESRSAREHLSRARAVDWTLNGGTSCPALRQTICKPDSSSHHRRNSPRLPTAKRCHHDFKKRKIKEMDFHATVKSLALRHSSLLIQRTPAGDRTDAAPSGPQISRDAYSGHHGHTATAPRPSLFQTPVFSWIEQRSR